MKTVLIFSGGMDSSVLLYQMLREGREVFTLGVNYGQRHAKELTFASMIASALKVPFCIADLSSIRPLLSGSSQTDDSIAVPEGHYAEESMKATIVPNRNMIMLAVAVGYAISIGAESVAYAAHAGDHAIYPDCRPEFVDALAHAVSLADWKKVRLDTPFIKMTKADIGALGYTLSVPFENTWSCYKGDEFHCGKCGTCTERKEALGCQDPTKYMEELRLI